MPRTLSEVAIFSLDVPSMVGTYSAELQELYGLPAEGPANTDILLKHVCPEDAERLTNMVMECAQNGGIYALPHPKMLDDGTEIWTCTLVQGVRDGSGSVSTVFGYVVDLTDDARDKVNSEVRDELSKALESRAIIDQAKGIVRVVYGMTEQEAFSLLRWVSQRSQVKLRMLAEHVVNRVATRFAGSDELRADLDALLHEAMKAVATLGPVSPVFAVEDGVETEPEGVSIAVHRSKLGAVVRVGGVLDLAAGPLINEAMKQAAKIVRKAHRSSREPQRVLLDIHLGQRIGPSVRDMVAEWDGRLAKDSTSLVVFDGAHETSAKEFLNPQPTGGVSALQSPAAV